MDQETQQHPLKEPQEEPQQKSFLRKVWQWLGFGEQGDKTGLDFIQVGAALSVPIVLAVGGYLFTANQNAHREAIEEQRVQDATLREYIGEMEDLILNEDLQKAESGDEPAAVARARTLTTLENLDPARKRSVLQFLYESDLITGQDSVVNLYGADFSGVDLSHTALPLANLGDPPPESLPKRVQEGEPEGPHAGAAGVTNLRGANLEGASLEGAHLPGFDLTEANLSESNLKDIVLGGASTGTPAGSAILRNLSLRGADLTCADLSGAQIRGIDWSDANLNMANLSGVEFGPLHIITQEQLDQAYGDEKTWLHPNLKLQPPPSWKSDSVPSCRWQNVIAREEAQEKKAESKMGGPKKGDKAK